MTVRCYACQNFSRPNRCSVYGRTHPLLVCTECPRFTERQPSPKPESGPSTGLCTHCRHDPGHRDQFCTAGNQHASATRCEAFRLAELVDVH